MNERLYTNCSILINGINSIAKVHTVKLDFKNRQDKNQLGFKNQISNAQLDQISFKNLKDKINLTLRTKMIVTKNVLKVKFDCILYLGTKQKLKL